QLGDVFPEIVKQKQLVEKVIQEEEISFFRTLSKGMKAIDSLQSKKYSEEADKIFGDQYETEVSDRANYLHAKKNEYINDKLKNDKEFVVDGKVAFELYDTYGFPIDLTRLIATERGWDIDEAGFQKEMEQQKNRSREATQTEAADWIEVKQISKVDFVGYDALQTESRIVKYRKITQKNKELFQVVLDKTPFYAESG